MASTLAQLLPGTMSFPCNTVQNIVHFVQTKKTVEFQRFVRTGQKDVGNFSWVKCRLTPQVDLSQPLVLFEPEENNGHLQQMDIGGIF